MGDNEADERVGIRGLVLGDIFEAHRVTPTGTTLSWHVTTNESPAGVIPFLISWGDTQPPATSAAPGLSLASFHIEHPEPVTLKTPLYAVGATVEVRAVLQTALVARIDGPYGVQELR